MHHLNAMTFHGFLRTQSPDVAVCVATLGFLLICVEFNRPGRILPAAFGLVLSLFAIASLLRTGVEVWPACLIGVSAAIIIANAWRRLPVAFLLAATLALIVDLRFLVGHDRPRGVSWFVAILCGSGAGVLIASLTRVAFYARRAKALD